MVSCRRSVMRTPTQRRSQDPSPRPQNPMPSVEVASTFTVPCPTFNACSIPVTIAARNELGEVASAITDTLADSSVLGASNRATSASNASPGTPFHLSSEDGK